MLLNCKQCNKNVNNWFVHYTVCVLSLLTFIMVLMTWWLTQMKVYFPLLCDKWRIRMPKNVLECWLKCKNRYWICFTRKWSFFSSLMNVTSSNCSPFHANGAHFLVMNSKRWTCPNLLFNLLSDSVLMCSNKCKIIHSKKDEIRRSLAQSTGQLQNIRWFNI